MCTATAILYTPSLHNPVSQFLCMLSFVLRIPNLTEAPYFHDRTSHCYDYVDYIVQYAIEWSRLL